MPEPTLRSLVTKHINLYLKQDNKPSFSIFQFFSRQGATGRQRAEAMQKMISSKAVEDENIFNILRQNVMMPHGEGDLGTSRKLRIRIMQALCEHQKIKLEDIEHKVRNELRILCNATQGRAGGVCIDDVWIRVMKYALEAKQNLRISL